MNVVIKKDRRLKEQYIKDINDNDNMMTEIIKELTTTKKMKEITSEQVLL